MKRLLINDYFFTSKSLEARVIRLAVCLLKAQDSTRLNIIVDRAGVILVNKETEK